MRKERLPWDQELAIVDRTLKKISSIVDPEDLVDAYWQGIGELLPILDYVALSRRNIAAPDYLITRSSRFTEHPNPWKERERLPRLTGGLLGELIYANKPVFIENLAEVLKVDDPGWFHIQGYQRLIALPQYDNGEGLNVIVMLIPEGVPHDRTMLPVMHWQAGLFGRGTQNLVLRNQLGEAIESLDREMKVVGEIQRSLLPQQAPDIPGLDAATFYRSCTQAGGDSYDCFPVGDGRWGLLITDVSGHGTPAAVLMAIIHALVHAPGIDRADPGAFLSLLNNQLTRSYTTNGTFVTAFYGVLDASARELVYASAGHCPPRIRRGGKILPLDACGNLPMGIIEGQTYDCARATLQADDVLAFYTDGITEVMGPTAHPFRPSDALPIPKDVEASALSTMHRPMFGVEGLDDCLRQVEDASAEKWIERIMGAANAFGNFAPPNDDQTMIVIRVT